MCAKLMNADKTSPTPVTVRALALLFVVAIPLRILAIGFLPGDDALRHAAKAISGKPWSEILVLRPEIVMDSHPGWHALLGAFHSLTGADAQLLVLFSVAFLFVAINLAPLILLRRPEAWLLTLLLLAVAEPRILIHFLIGRPFLLSVAVLILLGLLVPRAERRTPPAVWLPLGALTLLFGITIWIHPVFYPFGLPILACLLARRFLLAGWLSIAVAGGALLAGLMVGSPFILVEQTLKHVLLAVLAPASPGTRVYELSPWDGSPIFLAFVVILLLWRSSSPKGRTALHRAPLLLLAGLGWVLGFTAMRFWAEWGLPAALVWVARSLDDQLAQRTASADPRRLVIVLCAGLAALLASSSDVQGRWRPSQQPLAVLADPAVREMLPDPGGILYTDEIGLFFQLFYRLPHAPWRYVIGYEPALMPPEDLATFRRILVSRTSESFAPWVDKMQSADRLIVRSAEGQPPIAGLEWRPVARQIWSGRKPATSY